MRQKRVPIVSSAVAFRLSRFSKPYRQRLLAGLRDLQEFCIAEAQCSLTFILSHIHRADELLAEYVLQKHRTSEGQKLYVVKHALLSCQHMQPRLKGHISTAWANLKVWEEQRTSRLRPPLPVPLWLMMIGLARAHATVVSLAEEKLQWRIFATLLEVGLLCMFRPGELLKLHHSDISLPGDFTFSQPFASGACCQPKEQTPVRRRTVCTAMQPLHNLAAS